MIPAARVSITPNTNPPMMYKIGVKSSLVINYYKLTLNWLNTNVILLQFANVNDKHQAYRESMQKYSKEEQRTWEDLRHGISVGNDKFVKK